MLCWLGKWCGGGDFESNPDVEPLELADGFHTIPLEALVRMKLNSFRDKDRVHIRDMISLDMIDHSWTTKYPPELGQRLQAILDDPDG